MKRRKTLHERVSHERWMISYADFVTLLFALFVVMFASSQGDRKKVSEAVRRAFSGETPKTSAILGGTVDQVGVGNAMRNGPGGSEIYTPVQHSGELLPSLEFLDRELAKQIAEGRVAIHMEARGMVVSLRDAGYFVSGSDELAPEAYPVLDKISETILKTANPIRLEGHTDLVPIHTARFHSNWDLSTARGIAMLEALQARFHIPIERMAVAGYASNFPVAENDTVEGRAKNRRVDIVILSQSGSVSVPESLPSGSP
ncbi:MAG: flagellar motor protein MotB [Acidobacteriota bacterium]